MQGDEGEAVGDVTLSGPDEAESTWGHDVATQTPQSRNGHQNGHDHASVTDHLLSKSLKIIGIKIWFKKAPERFELSISCLLDRRFNQLNHGANLKKLNGNNIETSPV